MQKHNVLKKSFQPISKQNQTSKIKAFPDMKDLKNIYLPCIFYKTATRRDCFTKNRKNGNPEEGGNGHFKLAYRAFSSEENKDRKE